MNKKKPVSLSSGVVVVRWIDQQCHYLCLRAYKYWDFPKGMVEPGETPRQAAIREVEEETTLTDLHFHWGEVYRETPVYRKKRARFYLAEAPTGRVDLPVNEALGRPEHHEFRWMTYPVARAQLVTRLQDILDWAHGIIEKQH
jgi:bis(5'-nucleosidyl)-tetraphosphatase